MRFKIFTFTAVLLLSGVLAVSAQETADTKEVKDENVAEKFDTKKGLTNGVQVAEFAILVYSNIGGRPALSQIRKTTIEIGKIKSTNPDGTSVTSEYDQRIERAENLEKEKVRLNQRFPDAEYALVYNGNKVFGLYNNSVFTPREDAVSSFESRIWHGLEALLRYKENGAEVKLEKEETILGVTFYVVSVTDKANRKTTFYISKKSFRVMMLEYEENGIKYKRKFYDHNLAQGTLVPYRSVLWADGKIVEEKDISTIAFGQTLNDGIFDDPTASTP
ncbi:MAG: hypothetical protein KDB79_08730 [Acidobacteria bacterium]|nr:hypothetical protein [Acidobacteriota bacterium]